MSVFSLLSTNLLNRLYYILHTKCSLQSSTATNGGQFRLEIAEWSLFPAFATMRGVTSMPSVYASPPKTPTAVCMVLEHNCCWSTSIVNQKIMIEEIEITSYINKLKKLTMAEHIKNQKSYFFTNKLLLKFYFLEAPVSMKSAHSSETSFKY